MIAVTLIGTLASLVQAGPMDDQFAPLLEPIQLPERQLRPRTVELIGMALDQPDTATRIEALHAIGAYPQFGRTELAAKVVQMLNDTDDLIRRAALQTADNIDARPAADKALTIVTDGKDDGSIEDNDAIIIADRMLGRWQVAEAVALWTDRLNRNAAPSELLVSAVKALDTIDTTDASAIKALRTCVEDAARPLPARQAAAESLGRRPDGQTVALAARLTDQSPKFAQVLAVKLLVQDQSDAALALLRKLQSNDEPAVQGEAMRCLLAMDAAHLWPYAAETIGSTDSKVRLLTARSLATRRTDETVTLLVRTLDDLHPQVRSEARLSLARLAADDASLRTSITQKTRKIVDNGLGELGDETSRLWRQVEQAALLLADPLDDKAGAMKLLRLAEHPRLEVGVAAVSAVRALDVEATRPGLLDLFNRMVGKGNSVQPRFKQLQAALPLKPTDQQRAEHNRQRDALLAEQAHYREIAAEAAQTLGVWRYAAAEGNFRGMVAKPTPAEERARASAIWALGFLLEGRDDAQLASALVGRMTDGSLMNPERFQVRLASAVTIGRMHSAGPLGTLQTMRDQGGIPLRRACGWAIEQITGEKPPPMKFETPTIGGLFLAPMPEKKK